jgi:hypothetical protein
MSEADWIWRDLERMLGDDPERRTEIRQRIADFGFRGFDVTDAGEVVFTEDHDDEAFNLRMAAAMSGRECHDFIASLAPSADFDVEAVTDFILDPDQPSAPLRSLRHVAVKARDWRERSATE